MDHQRLNQMGKKVSNAIVCGEIIVLKFLFRTLNTRLLMKSVDG